MARVTLGAPAMFADHHVLKVRERLFALDGVEDVYASSGWQTVIVIADEIETAFTYGQDWPLGSALSVVLILIIGSMAIFGISRVDLDSIIGRRR